MTADRSCKILLRAWLKTLSLLILRCPAKPGLEGRKTVPRASRLACGQHLNMRNVENPI